MIRNIAVGIDVGSRSAKVAVVEFSKSEKIAKVIAAVQAESRGIRRDTSQTWTPLHRA